MLDLPAGCWVVDSPAGDRRCKTSPVPPLGVPFAPSLGPQAAQRPSTRIDCDGRSITRCHSTSGQSSGQVDVQASRPSPERTPISRPRSPGRRVRLSLGTVPRRASLTVGVYNGRDELCAAFCPRNLQLYSDIHRVYASYRSGNRDIGGASLPPSPCPLRRARYGIRRRRSDDRGYASRA